MSADHNIYLPDCIDFCGGCSLGGCNMGITSSLSCEQLVPTPIGLSRSIFPRHPFSQFSNYFLSQASDKPSKSYTTACTLYSTILDMYTYSSLPLLLDNCLPLWEKDCENHYHTYLGFLVLLHRNIFSFSLQGQWLKTGSGPYIRKGIINF